MYATLVVVGGKADKRQLEIRLPALLGRSRQADLTIAHSLISREHCELREHEGVVLLTDLGSLNGTYFGNRRIRRVELLPKDQFSVGPLTFEIQYESQGALSASDSTGAAPGSAGLPVELPDPIEPTPVELDEAVRPSVPGRDRVQTVTIRDVVGRRSRVLPGFTLREELLEPEEEGEPCDREGGETIAIDPAHGTVGADSRRYDAPTSQCQASQDEPPSNPNTSARDDPEQAE